MTDSEGVQKRILVVEDDPDFGPELKGQLEKLTPAVDFEACVDDAVNALRNQRYDLLVLDIWLPKTRADLQRQRELERQYDDLTRLLIESDDDEVRKTELRGEMEQMIAESRMKLERRGGLMVIENLAKEAAPAAILFLTAIGNEDMSKDAINVARSISCKTYRYLVKPQPPEAIDAHARALLCGE